MRALGKCSKCAKQLETDCRGCIESGTGACQHKGKIGILLKSNGKSFLKMRKS